MLPPITSTAVASSGGMTMRSAIDELVAAQWSVAAHHEVLGPVLAGASELGPLGGLLAMVDEQSGLRSVASRAASPHLDDVFRTLDPTHLECITNAATSGEPAWVRASDGHQLELALEPQHAGVGAWAAVPLHAGDAVVGVLATAFAEPLMFDEAQRALLLALGRLTALALSSGFAHVGDSDAGMQHVARERERLARDLHDGVVQDVIASAMNLATLAPLVPDAVRPRVERIIESHDLIVRELRKTIFSLRETNRVDIAASRELTGLAAEAESMLGFRPTLHLSGPVDDIDTTTLGHLRLSLHEILANVARHAAAGHVDVTVAVDEKFVNLVVVDDGLGITPHIRRGNGLDNLAHRAHQLGGRCDFSSGSRGGAIVRWTVPRLPPSHNGSNAEKEPT